MKSSATSNGLLKLASTAIPGAWKNVVSVLPEAVVVAGWAAAALAVAVQNQADNKYYLAPLKLS